MEIPRVARIIAITSAMLILAGAAASDIVGASKPETISPPKHRLCYPKKRWIGLDRDRPCAYRMLKSGKVVVKTADGRGFFPVPPSPTFKGDG